MYDDEFDDLDDFEEEEEDELCVKLTSVGSAAKQKKTRPVVMGEGAKVLPVDDFRSAVMRANKEMVVKMIEQGMPVDEPLKTGWSALMYAATEAACDVISVLLEAGADPNFSCKGNSALLCAAGTTKVPRGDLRPAQAVEVLLAAGANVNVPDLGGQTALMLATRENRVDVMEKLVAAGATVNDQDSRGWTALCWAAARGQVAAAKCLLSHGADVSPVTSRGETALSVSRKMGRCAELTALLASVSGEEEAEEPAPPAQLNGSKELAVNGGDAVLPVNGNSGACGDASASYANGDAGTESETSTPSSPQKAAADVYRVPDSDSHVERTLFNDLELFLYGLSLGDLVPLFIEQRVNLPTLLQMTDEDLVQLGVTQFGVRRKILEGTRAVHKKDWDSANTLKVEQASNLLSVAEAVAVLQNLQRHLAFAKSTSEYIFTQLNAQRQALKQHEAEVLKEIQQTALKSSSLATALASTFTPIAQLPDERDMTPDDVIPSCDTTPQRRGWARVTLGFALGAGVIGAVAWNRGYLGNFASKS